MANNSIRPDQTPPVTGSTAEDVRPYEEALKETADVMIDEPIEGSNLRHHESFIGTFDYDPKQFEVQYVDMKPSQYGNGGSFPVLRYIGKETDGHKIQIPEGVENGAFMFYQTKVESVPKLPNSLTNGYSMFMECHSLKDGRTTFPPRMTEADFMFANCENMAKGPKVVPGTVKEASFMFADCAGMQNTPALGHGVEVTDGMFGGCKSLKNPPKLPRSVQSSTSMTFGCDGIDRTKDDLVNHARDTARQKFEKKLDRPTFGARVGSMFSALLQVHAMRKMGYGVVMAPIMAHQMRKAGVFSRDLSGGVAAVAMGHGGLAGRTVYQAAMNASAKNAQKQAQRRQQKLEQWDRLYGEGTNFNRQLKAQAAKGARDEKSGLFLRILDMSSPERRIYRESHGNATIYAQQEKVLRESWATSAVDVNEKKRLAKWYKDQLADKVAYCAEAEAAIKADPRYSSAKRERAMAGLDLMKQDMFSPLTDSMKNLQNQYQLFNDGDQRDIDRMLKSATGATLFHQEQRQAEASYSPHVTFHTSREAAASQQMSTGQPSAGRQEQPAAQTQEGTHRVVRDGIDLSNIHFEEKGKDGPELG